MRIQTPRLILHSAAEAEMRSFIARQQIPELKAAYEEMLAGCLQHTNQWEWYAIWMIELSDGTHVGELCFKGIAENGQTEIGYGISAEFQGRGYATEAAAAAVSWALDQPGITGVTAETEADNTASLRVLEKCGFVPLGCNGEEGPRFIRMR